MFPSINNAMSIEYIELTLIFEPSLYYYKHSMEANLYGMCIYIIYMVCVYIYIYQTPFSIAKIV